MSTLQSFLLLASSSSSVGGAAFAHKHASLVAEQGLKARGGFVPLFRAVVPYAMKVAWACAWFLPVFTEPSQVAPSSESKTVPSVFTQSLPVSRARWPQVPCSLGFAGKISSCALQSVTHSARFGPPPLEVPVLGFSP